MAEQHTDTPPTAAERLAALANAKGVSARELARRTGMGRMAVQRRLNGTSRLQADDLETFAAALGEPATALVDYTPALTTRGGAR